jgi:hypothetical protein
MGKGAAADPGYSYSCFRCEKASPPWKSYTDCDKVAGKAGWVIGHVDGQAHIACPDCAHALFDPVSLDQHCRRADEESSEERGDVCL